MNFDEIQWGASTFFLKLEMDATGGNNFGIAATERFCSVPYSFRAAVTDSISGVDMDSLRQMMIPNCYCDMQQAYDNGSIVNINNSTIQNGISINNNSAFSGSTFFSAVGGTNNSNPGFFSIKNSNNTNTALGARTIGLGNALQLFSANAVNAQPTVIGFHTGLNSVFQARITNPLNTQPTILAITNGVGHAGYFQVANQNNNLSAIKAEVITGVHNLNAGGGEFLIAEPLNTAPVIDVQTNGLGSAGLFHLNNTQNSSTGIELIQKSTLPTMGLFAETENNGNGGGAAMFRTNGTQHNTYTVGITHFGKGYPLIVNKVFNSGAQSLNYPAFYCLNQSYGPGVYINHSNTAANSASPALYVREAGRGITAQFLGMGGPQNLSDVVNISGTSISGRILRVNNNNNPTNASNIFEINNSGVGTLLRAFTTNVLSTGKYVAHFTTNNSANSSSTVFVETNGSGTPIYALNNGTGQGSIFLSNGSSSSSYALNAFGLTGDGYVHFLPRLLSHLFHQEQMELQYMAGYSLQPPHLLVFLMVM